VEHCPGATAQGSLQLSSVQVPPSDALGRPEIPPLGLRWPAMQALLSAFDITGAELVR